MSSAGFGEQGPDQPGQFSPPPGYGSPVAGQPGWGQNPYGQGAYGQPGQNAWTHYDQQGQYAGQSQQAQNPWTQSPQSSPYEPVSPQFRQDFAPRPVAPRRTNSLAVASLCCAFGQVLVGPLAGIPAVVLGLMSRRQIRQTGEEGMGMATAGLALGVAGILLVVLFVVLAVATVTSMSHGGPGPTPPFGPRDFMGGNG